MIELGLKNPQNIRKSSSYGYNNKVNPNNSASSLSSNRRVEIYVKYEKKIFIATPIVPCSLLIASSSRVDFINNIKYTDLKGIVDDKNIETEHKIIAKINVPEFLLREEIESDKTNVLGGNIKLGLEYKITNKFKLMAGAYGMYDKKAEGFDIKAQYGDKSKFYTDLTLKYGYSNILRDVNINDEKPVLISKKNMKKNSLID